MLLLVLKSAEKAYIRDQFLNPYSVSLVKHFRAMFWSKKPNMVRKSVHPPVCAGAGCQQLLTIGFIDCDITNVGRRGGMCVIQRQVIRHKSHYCQRIHTSYSL